jgi:type II restriction enzyme
MRLQMPVDLASAYNSPSQRARVVSEGWARENLYCPRCESPTLEQSLSNTRVVDFTCPRCAAAFQLKSQSHLSARRIMDSAYNEMRRAIEGDRTPHLLNLHYDRPSWRVRNLTLVPSFAFTLSCVEKRRPLGPNARRKGWIGCNILLYKIPADARIALISDGLPANPDWVRRRYDRLQLLERAGYERRGWMLDVLQVVRSLQRREFSLDDVYRHSNELRKLHPKNLHIHEKIRQQLQRLRDLGVLEFAGRGIYLLKD